MHIAAYIEHHPGEQLVTGHVIPYSPGRFGARTQPRG